MPARTQPRRSLAMDYVVMILTALLMSLNYIIFILPNQFAPSGLGGVNTMIQYVFHISVGWMTLVMNIPLAVVAFFKVDRQFALKTAVNVLVFAGTLLLMQNGVIDLSRFVYHTDDGRSTLLAPVAAGTLNGIIEALSLRYGGSTGGMDYVSAMIHKRQPAYSMTHISFCINLGIASLSYVVYNFRIEPVILCIVYCFITTEIGDRILRGGKTAMRVEMITAHPQEITDQIVTELHHSATILHAQGGYSHQDKTLLITIINRHQITRLMEIISHYPDTFAVVSQVSETVGNFNRRVR